MLAGLPSELTACLCCRRSPSSLALRVGACPHGPVARRLSSPKADRPVPTSGRPPPALRSTLQTLASPLQPTEPSATPPSAAALHSTFLSLAQLLKSHTTTLSLALGKQPPTPHAALPYLAKIGDDWKRLAFVVRSCDERQPTSELRKEWSWAQDELRDALAGLLETFVDRLFPSAGASSSSPAAAVDNEKYLQKTGVVYGVVDRAVRGLSRTPLDSIAKRWENDADGLRDGEVEAREMVEDDDEDDGDGEDSDGDDGANDDGADGASDDGSEDDWAKLLGEAGAKPTAAERDVIRSVRPWPSASLCPPAPGACRRCAPP